MRAALRFRFVVPCFIIALFYALPAVGITSAYAATFTVTNTADSGTGSLRAAITAANGAPGSTVAFNISNSDPNFSGGVARIQPATPLPPITANSTIIDGGTQTTAVGNTNPAGPEILIDGTLAGSGASGFVLNSANSVVKGLIINSFGGDGVLINGAGATNNNVQGCYIGTDRTGTAAQPNLSGVVISGGAQGNLIGGTTLTQRNLISGNTNNGVAILNPNTNNNRVQLNLIGTRIDAANNLGNGDDGINISDSASNNFIGNTNSALGNRIVYNHRDGVRVGDSGADLAVGNTIRGNSIFLNSGLGINLLGGSENGAGVTANDSGDPDNGPNAIQNYPLLTAVVASSSSTSNVTGALNSTPNASFAIDVYRNGTPDPSGFGEGNAYVGSTTVTTNSSGNATLNFSVNGVFAGQYFSATATNTSTGNTSEFSNTVQEPIIVVVTNTNDSGPGSLRAAITFANGHPGTRIVFNIANTDPNFSGGVYTIRVLTALPVITANSTIIDGDSQIAFNGNSNGGRPVIVLDGSQAGAGVNGLNIQASNCAVRKLVIQRFSAAGVLIQGLNSANNSVQSCFLGVDATGNTAAGNLRGVSINGGAHNNLIGGTTAALRNIISGNSGPGAVGVLVAGDNNQIFGNYIGTNAAGNAAVANAGDGVVIANSTGNKVGDVTAGAGNVIAFNTNNGVSLASPATGNTIRGNSIFSNGRLGIDLPGGTQNSAGVTANDNLDADSGVNNLQNYPVLTSAVAGGAATTVSGTLNSLANTSFIIDLYRNATADPSGFGEGQIHVSSRTVTTDGSGNATFSFNLNGSFAGQFFTATATNQATGDTSEFSQARQAIVSIVTVTTTADSGAGSLRAAITFANTTPNTTIRFNIPAGFASGGVFTIAPISVLPVITANGTTVDATTQTAFSGNTNANGPEVVLNGAAAGAGTDGLKIIASNCLVKGLVINGFSGNGIAIIGATSVSNRIQSCYIGTNAAGTAAVANDADGIILVNGTHNNLIGGNAAGLGNIISGNGGNGVLLANSGTDGNLLQGNFIGTNAAGTAAIANGSDGVLLASGAKNNIIGGTSVAARNVISGNGNEGILVDASGQSGTGTTTILGNYIGTNASGSGAVGNNLHGISLVGGSAANLIGGATAGSRNVISGNRTGGIIMVGTGTNTNRVQGNFIGTNAAGTAAIANGTVAAPANGISLVGGVQSNTIGGTVAAARNIVSGNTGSGILISDAGTNSNSIFGNYIGVNAAGTAKLANTQQGVLIAGGAQTNFVGGSGSASGNVISGNGREGVQIAGTGTNSNKVLNNRIGTNAAGSAALGNGTQGVLVANGAQSTLIGSTASNGRNIISGNTSLGILISDANTNKTVVSGNLIGTDASGATAIANGAGGILVAGSAQASVIGGTGAGTGNVISGNTGSGVQLSGANTKSNSVLGNFIGVGGTGTAKLANTGAGVLILNGASNNTIGGTTVAARNVIAGNGTIGVQIDGLNQAGTAGNLVQGNYIGVNASGNTGVANGAQGVLIVGGATGNSIGGTVAGARNIISGNTTDGILIANAGTTGNSVYNNYIGTNAAGDANLGNGGLGVGIVNGARGNFIGTTNAGNVIGGNNDAGILIADNGTNGNLVRGNRIGTNAVGTAAFPNAQGVLIVGGASSNTVGGTIATLRNLISGNAAVGVLIDGASTTSNQVLGNFIGTDINGTANLGNGSHGVLVSNAQKTVVGGAAAGTGNLISFNKSTGVLVTGTAAGTAIRGNAIFSNTQLGINLTGGAEDQFGVTANDSGDADTGPNALQNYPVINTVTNPGSSITVNVLLNSTPSTTFAIDFFRSTSADPSGFGEGQIYMGSQTVTTNATGTVTTSFTISGSFAGQFITTTATNLSTANTSEFSQAKAVGVGSATSQARDSGLSAASASITGKIQLRFTSYLADGAADSEHYSVTVNGQATDIESVSASSNSATLQLAGGLQHGDQVSIAWHDLDSNGRSFNGATTVTVP